MGSQPTKKFTPVSSSNNKASSSASPAEFDSAYESLYSAFTSPSGTSSSNTSSPTSSSTCMTMDTFSARKLNSAPLMDPLTLNTVDDLPNNLTNSRSLASIRLDPIESSRKQEKYSNIHNKNKYNSNGTKKTSENDKSSRFNCHRKSYPMSIGKQKGSRIELLPPIESLDFSSSKTLPFKEYKKWLISFRSKSQENESKSSYEQFSKNQSKLLVQPKIRCQTATIRRESDLDRKEKEEMKKKSSSSKLSSNSTERIFTISDKSYLNSGKDESNESHVTNGLPANGKQKQRKSSIVTMNCYNSDLIHGGSNTVFDLNALNDALTKPRNKVVPAAVSLLSVNHLKSTGNIF